MQSTRILDSEPAKRSAGSAGSVWEGVGRPGGARLGRNHRDDEKGDAELEGRRVVHAADPALDAAEAGPGLRPLPRGLGDGLQRQHGLLAHLLGRGLDVVGPAGVIPAGPQVV